MPRSAIDATRFTPTTPHASAKPPAHSASPSLGPSSSWPPSSSPQVSSAAASRLTQPNQPGPPGETPLQKVRRLKEAAARAKDARLSGFDRWYLWGRYAADKAHRFTALTLIGFSTIAGVVSVYTIGDMIVYNRRRKREWISNQKATHDAALYEAQNAILRGTANEEQVALLEEDDMKRMTKEMWEAEKAEKKENGLLARTKRRLFNGMRTENDVAVGGARDVAKGKEDEENENRQRIAAKIQELRQAKIREETAVEPKTKSMLSRTEKQPQEEIKKDDKAAAEELKEGQRWTQEQISRAGEPKKDGMFTRIKSWLVDGLKKEDDVVGDRAGNTIRGKEPVAENEDIRETFTREAGRNERTGSMAAPGQDSAILRAMEEKNSQNGGRRRAW